MADTTSARKPREYPKPRLTDGDGTQRAKYLTDAPRALQALGMTQVPRALKGPAMRGAYVRGWCDGVRSKKADSNPYRRAGSGWQHGMAGHYADGWTAGKRVARVEQSADGMSETEYQKLVELRERVRQIQRGELVSPRSATKRVRKARS